MTTRTKPRRPIPAIQPAACVERPRRHAEPGSCCPFAGFNGDVELPDDVVRAWIRQEREKAETAARQRVLALLRAEREEENRKAKRPDLGPSGGAAVARQTMDTEVMTRGHGKVVARTVETEVLDVHFGAGRLSGPEHRAGKIVAKSLRTMPRPRVTAHIPYASDPGLEDDGEVLTEEERAEQRERRHATRREAEAIVGPDCWPDVLAVCGADADDRPMHNLPRLRLGLSRLVVAWRLRNGA